MTASSAWAPARPPRFAAAFAATAVTLAFLAALRLPVERIGVVPPRTSITVVLPPLIERPARADDEPRAEAAPRRPSTGGPPAGHDVRRAPITEPPFAGGSIAGVDPSLAPVAQPAASAPQTLRLDLDPRATRSAIRSMADAAGAYIGDDAPSERQRMTERIARAGKQDCIAPNANGSLLSALVIAYEAATGRCR